MSHKCSWRSKVKYCKTCGEAITDLPKSVFITKQYCSIECRRTPRGAGHNSGQGNTSTKSRVALLIVLANFINCLSTLNYRACGEMALDFMENFDEKTKTK